MPPAIRTIRISDATWNLHRDTIVKLYLDDRYQLRELIDIMKTRHRFEASISQYEARLKYWKIRRKLKVAEWRRIFNVIDSLLPGTRSRVVLCGRVVDEKAVRRARRECKRKPGIGVYDETNPLLFGYTTSNASVEIQRPDGTWFKFPGENLIDPILALPRVADRQMIDTYHQSQTQRLPLHTPEGDSSILASIDDYLLSNNFAGSPTENSNIINSSPYLPNSEQLPVQLHHTLTAPEVSPPGAFSGNCFLGPYMWLWDLCFSEVDNQLASWRIHPLAVQSGIIRQLEHAQIPRKSHEARYHNYSKIDYYLRNLKTLVPGALPPRQLNDTVMIGFGENATDNSLIQGLMFSIANASAGLEGIPIGSVLLSLSPTSSTLLIQFLGSRPCHLTKAIAESLFRAAIESEDNCTLRNIVDTGLVDVNRVVLFHQWYKHTAIEHVVMLRNLTGMEILLNAKADLSRALRYHDMISLYSSGLSYIDEKWLSFCNLIRQYLPDAILQWEVGLPIPWTIDAIRLSLALFAPLEHSKLVEAGVLHHVAKIMEDTEALNIVRKIHQLCQKTGCGRCFDKQYGEGHHILITSTLNGRCELAKFILPFCEDENILKALSISIRLRHRDLINIILDNMEYSGCQMVNEPLGDSPLVSSGRNRRLESILSEYRPILNGDLLHPLAEALLSNEESIVDQLETGVLFESLSGEGLMEVLAAAAEMNRIDYIQSLLERFPTTDGSSLTSALFIAIQKGFDSLSFKLLELGASFNDVNMTINGNVYNGLPLNAAIEQRNFRLAHAILSAGIGQDGVDVDTFQAIFESGNMSIFNEILRFLPHALFTAFQSMETEKSINFLSHMYQTGRYDVLDIFIPRLRSLNRPLRGWSVSAITSGDATLVQFLLSHGIIELNGSTLGLAAKIGNTTILQMLLHQIELQAPLASVRLPLRRAIDRDGLVNFECLSILLSSPIIHLEFEADDNSPDSFNPLGTAISIANKEPDVAQMVVEKLLDAGCHVNDITNVQRPFGKKYIAETALLQAIDTGNERLVRLLIDRGADVDAPAYMTVKQTPLQKAADIGSLSIVKLLLRHKASVNASPAARSGGTALQYAAISGNCNIAAELLSHGAHLHTRPPLIDGRWPIEGAAEYGRLHMIEYLWIAKANMDLPEDCESGFEEKYCRRAMKLAEENGHIACRDLIAEKAGLSNDDV
ncbi:hypothetical protein Daesc_002390 [Daldinia eschscholtzii]|uniref:Clr5 domain-containing protein n=1 Tax=Daldinia eschscholtzii TaxID=292717 RepID=A0AAX6MWX0_9PEZI